MKTSGLAYVCRGLATVLSWALIRQKFVWTLIRANFLNITSPKRSKMKKFFENTPQNRYEPNRTDQSMGMGQIKKIKKIFMGQTEQTKNWVLVKPI